VAKVIGRVAISAYADDCGRVFRLKATMPSIENGHLFRRRRPGRRCRHEQLIRAFVGGVKFSALGCDLPHALSFECKAVSVVHDAVEDGISDGWIGDNLVPVLDRHPAKYNNSTGRNSK
jgi:hypothetical protein